MVPLQSAAETAPTATSPSIANTGNSRRKLYAIARNVQVKPLSITFARESSYVKLFDEHFQKVMAPAYEKATGIKIEYQIQAAGGGAVPQLVSMVENKSGPDLACVQHEC